MTRDEEIAQCREFIAHYQARLDELESLPTIRAGRWRQRDGEIVNFTFADAAGEDQVEGEFEDGGYQTWDINGRWSDCPREWNLVEYLGPSTLAEL